MLYTMAGRTPYSRDAKDIMLHVHAFCQKEKEEGLTISLKKTAERGSALTGVSKATLKRVVGQCNKTSGAKPSIARVEQLKMDTFDDAVVRRTIHRMYIKKILPTLNNVRTSLSQNIGYTGSSSHLRKILRRLGFTYRRCEQNRKVLMERSDVVISRMNYLRKVKMLRETGYSIVYTDETYVHTNHAVNKCWQDGEIGLNVPFSKGNTYIFCRIIVFSPMFWWINNLTPTSCERIKHVCL